MELGLTIPRLNDLIEYRFLRRERELQRLAQVMSVAVNQPKDLASLFKESEQAQRRLDDGEKMEVSAEQYEQWWE